MTEADVASEHANSAPVESPTERSDAPVAEPGRLLFLAVVPFATLFVVTILVMIAAAFGDPDSPLGGFFDEHGLTIIAWESLATIAAALVAMTIDRRRSLRSTAGNGETPAARP
jgi:hypothetical protein